MAADMRRNALDVLHDRDGIGKYVPVDTLQDVALPAIGMVNAYEVRVIDVTAAEAIHRIHVAGQFEALQDVGEVSCQTLRPVTVRAGAVAQAPRVKSGKSRELPRSLFDASLRGVTADQAAAS